MRDNPENQVDKTTSRNCLYNFDDTLVFIIFVSHSEFLSFVWETKEICSPSMVYLTCTSISKLLLTYFRTHLSGNVNRAIVDPITRIPASLHQFPKLYFSLCRIQNYSSRIPRLRLLVVVKSHAWFQLRRGVKDKTATGFSHMVFMREIGPSTIIIASSFPGAMRCCGTKSGHYVPTNVTIAVIQICIRADTCKFVYSHMLLVSMCHIIYAPVV